MPFLAAALALAPVPAARAGSVALRAVTQIYEAAEATDLRFPEGVACNGTALAVADTGNSRIVLFDVRDGVVTAGATLTVPETPVPVRLAFRSGGGLLVLDGRSRRIGRVGAGGGFEGWIDPAVQGGMVPRSFHVAPDGKIWVLDAGTPRVLVLDAAGTLEREIALPASARSPADLAAGTGGEAWIVDGIASALYGVEAGAAAATPIAELPRERFDLAHAVALDASGRLFVVDRGAGRITVLGRDGSVQDVLLDGGWAAGELRYPGAICIDANGLVFVADRENHRVQIFSLR
jgi:DNA-binding beta-propeller fold protein YncE